MITLSEWKKTNEIKSFIYALLPSARNDTGVGHQTAVNFNLINIDNAFFIGKMVSYPIGSDRVCFHYVTSV